MRYSEKWKNWVAILDLKTCRDCRENHGKIYSKNEIVRRPPPIHLYCRCTIKPMKVITAGNATDNGSVGADWFLKYFNRLPDYYIDENEAYDLGWEPKKGNLAEVAPQKMLYGGVFKNREGKLPVSRIWYEADINYKNGYRNDERILFSNDGLIFVTYDHYETFYEIG